LALWPSCGKLRDGPSFRGEQLDSRWTDFGEILYLNLLLKSCETVKVWLKSDKQRAFNVTTFVATLVTCISMVWPHETGRVHDVPYVTHTVYILSCSGFCTDIVFIFITSFLCFRLVVLLCAVARKSVSWHQNLNASGAVGKVRLSLSRPWNHIWGVKV
jgi:hypothetical protein